MAQASVAAFVLRRLEHLANETITDPNHATCPVRDHTNDGTLSVFVGEDGGIGLDCKAGCEHTAILKELNLSFTDLKPGSTKYPHRVEEVYDYPDPSTGVLAQKVRLDSKAMWWRHRPKNANGKWVVKRGPVKPTLYHAGRIVNTKPLYIVEGEKDVHAIEAAGGIATCNPDGAGKWKSQHTAVLRGMDRVIVIADKDGPGYAHALTVSQALSGTATVTVVEAASGKDAADHLEAGMSLDELVAVSPDTLLQGAMAGDAEPAEPTTEAATSNQEEKQLFRTAAEILAARKSGVPMRQVVVPRLVWWQRVSTLCWKPKHGKSTLMAAAAAAVTRGRPFLGDSTMAGRVLWVTMEEHDDDILDRAITFDTDLDKLLVMSYPRERLAAVAEVVKDEEPVLVVVDTLLKFSGIKDEGQSGPWEEFYNQLLPVAHQGSAGWMLNHHARRDGEYRGSTAIVGGVDMVFENKKGKDGARRRVEPWGRWAEAEFTLLLEGTTFTAMNSKMGAMRRQIRNYVREHPGCNHNAVVEAVVGARKTISDLVKEMLDDGVIENRGTERSHKYHNVTGIDLDGRPSLTEEEEDDDL